MIIFCFSVVLHSVQLFWHWGCTSVKQSNTSNIARNRSSFTHQPSTWVDNEGSGRKFACLCMSTNYALCHYLDGLLGVLLQGGSLALEDGHVGFKQVLPLHALLPGHGTHQNGSIQVLEGHFLLVSGDDLCGEIKWIYYWWWMNMFIYYRFRFSFFI